MDIRPIFVVGVEHSGTTILYRMLARHPHLAWLSQYSMRGGEIPERTRVPFSPLIKRLGTRFLRTSWRKNFGIFTMIVPNPDEGRQIWDHYLPTTKRFLTEEDYTEALAQRVVSFCEQECRSWRKNRLVVKLPWLSRAVLLLNRVFPTANFIHIIRDGKAVALSNEHKFARSPWGPAVALRESAEYWKDTVLHLKDANTRIGGRFTVIKYESLCKDVRGIMSSTMKSSGLAEIGEVLGKLPATLSITNERQYERCSSEGMKLLNEILQPTLAEYGYSPFDIPSVGTRV